MIPYSRKCRRENYYKKSRRKRYAACGDVGSVDKKDTIIQSHIREQYYLTNARTDMINEENDIIMGNI